MENYPKTRYISTLKKRYVFKDGKYIGWYYYR